MMIDYSITLDISSVTFFTQNLMFYVISTTFLNNDWNIVVISQTINTRDARICWHNASDLKILVTSLNIKDYTERKKFSKS